MEFINIFLIGGFTGLIFSVISMSTISAYNSETYPIGGFLPSIWMFYDFGIQNQIVVIGILIMGGMTGFYLTLTFWKENPIGQIQKKTIDTKKIQDSNKEILEKNSTIIIREKSLAKFL